MLDMILGSILPECGQSGPWRRGLALYSDDVDYECAGQCR